MHGKASLQRVKAQIEALTVQELDARGTLSIAQCKPGIRAQLSRLIVRLEKEQKQLRKVLIEASERGMEHLP